MTAAAQRRGVGPAIIDPRLIRDALAYHEAGHSLQQTAIRHRVHVSSLTRWKGRQHAAAAAGVVWPSEADIALWDERQPERRQARRERAQWQLRVTQEGPQLIDSTGTARRIRALATMGWRCQDVAERLGCSQQRVARLMGQDQPTVLRSTAHRLAAVYEQLCMTQGPSARSRRLAAEAGWAPPLAWDDHTIDDPAARPRYGRAQDVVFDEVAVERAAGGERVHLRPVERAEAIARLRASGLTFTQIATRLHTTKRAVERHLAAHRARAAAEQATTDQPTADASAA